MTTGEENKFTDKQEKFLNLLKQYPVKSPETIVNYVSSQGEDVLEDPQRLMQALADCEISAVRRKQIWKHWLSDQRIEVPPELEKKVGMPKDEIEAAAIREAEEKKGREEKYSVDTDTGAIKVASTTDKRALTWDEADKLSKDIIKKIDTRKKAEESKATKPAEGPFTIGDDGTLKVKEGASLTAMDVAVMNAVGKAQEAGDKRSPMEILEEKVREFKTLQELTGGGKKESGVLDDVEKLQKIKEFLGGDAETKALLKTMNETMAAIAAGGGSSVVIDALEKKVDALTTELQNKDKEALENRISSLTSQIGSMEDRLKKEIASGTSKDEYSIMHEFLTTVKDEARGIRNDLAGFFGRRPPPMSDKERKSITEGISEGAKEEESLLEQEEKTFFGGEAKEK